MTNPFAATATATRAFGQADGSTAPAVKAAFGQPAQGGGAGSFITPSDLVGQLSLITPIKIESVPNDKGKPGEMKDRLTCDVVILTGPNAGREVLNQWLESVAIVGAAETALRQGTPAILGRLARLPMKGCREAYPTPEALEAAYATWDNMTKIQQEASGMVEPRHFYKLMPHTDEEAALAMAYLTERNA